MPARKLYDDDYYESTSTARKYSSYTKVEPRRNVKTGKNRRQNIKTKNNVSVITYRYNVISEKNLQTQNLKSELSKVESNLLTSQIEVEQETDLNKIEQYAKQQLGMQKPDKNQTIYVDTSQTGSTVKVEDDDNLFNKIIQGIKDFINKIF